VAARIVMGPDSTPAGFSVPRCQLSQWPSPQ
jgi:hypothetical protein